IFHDKRIRLKNFFDRILDPIPFINYILIGIKAQFRTTWDLEVVDCDNWFEPILGNNGQFVQQWIEVFPMGVQEKEDLIVWIDILKDLIQDDGRITLVLEDIVQDH